MAPRNDARTCSRPLPKTVRIGLAHAALNVGATLLFAGSFVLRLQGNRAAGRALAATGYLVSAAAAYLGGELVYREQLGVDHTAGLELPDDFAPVLAETNLAEGRLERVRYRDTPILLVRSGERISALVERCAHQGGPLAEGKLVTYGIHFQSGSDVVLPESAPVLRQVAAYMETNAAVKLKITGHTDSVGAPDSNLDLSKRRSAAVAKVLSEQFGIAADRFTTDGKGDTEAVASNDKPEGRAMNRRVEFAKL